MRKHYDANFEIRTISEEKSLNHCQVTKKYSATECPKMARATKMVLKMLIVRKSCCGPKTGSHQECCVKRQNGNYEGCYSEVAKTLHLLVNASCLWKAKMEVKRPTGHFICCV